MATKQMEIPGTRKKVHADIEKQAEKYTDIRDKRMSWGEKELVERDVLVELMKKHKLEKYVLEDGRVVEVDITEKVKVRRPKDANGDGDSDSEGE